MSLFRTIKAKADKPFRPSGIYQPYLGIISTLQRATKVKALQATYLSTYSNPVIQFNLAGHRYGLYVDQSGKSHSIFNHSTRDWACFQDKPEQFFNWLRKESR